MEFKLNFDKDFNSEFSKVYNDHNSSGGIPDEFVDEYYAKTKPKHRSSATLRILGCSDREYLSFIIGGLATQTDMSDSRKSRAMHNVANRLNISHEEASKLLKTLMGNSNQHAEEYSK